MFTIVALALLAAAFAAEEPIDIIKQNADVSFDGTFHNTFETTNGIKNKDFEAQEITGTIEYTAPDGSPVHLSWIANEYGFQPKGDQLPVGPSEADLPVAPPPPPEK